MHVIIIRWQRGKVHGVVVVGDDIMEVHVGRMETNANL